MDFPVLEPSVLLERLNPPEGPVDVILDTDTYNEIDDQFAVTYAVLSKERVNLKAVTAAPFFNERSAGPGDGMEKSYEEILRLFDRLGISPEGAAFKGSTDYLRDIEHPEESPAARRIVDEALAERDGPLYIAAVGAITNVASAILIEPAIIERIVVVWLGGNAHYWPPAREFNLRQDLNASRLIFDCGVPLVQMPCYPVVSHLHTTLPEMEARVKGRGPIGDYLYEIYETFFDDHYGRSKVIWDVTAIAWLVNAGWIPTELVHSPVLTDNLTWSVDKSRHFIRVAMYIHRDPIFTDFYRKLEAFAG